MVEYAKTLNSEQLDFLHTTLRIFLDEISDYEGESGDSIHTQVVDDDRTTKEFVDIFMAQTLEVETSTPTSI